MSEISEDRGKLFIQWIDVIAQPLVIISVILYLVEGELSLRNNWENSYDSPLAFLYLERAIAALFTTEIIVRWWRSKSRSDEGAGASYPFNVWGAIDLICVLPFWIGFFVPFETLGIIRTFRILRLLKLFRYSRNLQLTALKFYRAYHNLKGTLFALGVVWLFFAVVTLNLEHPEQSEKFGSLLDGAWFTIVTATTVGYGDASPTSVWGKVFVGLMLIPMVSTMGMAFAAFANASTTVQELEDDPEIDPIEEWKKERERMKRRKAANRNYQMKE